jgi:hypothetical protein
MKKSFDKNGHVQFSSPAEFADAVQNDISAGRRYRGDQAWTGETLDEAINRTRSGNPARVPEAERMLDRIQAQIDLERPEWVHDVAGAFPDVPAFLAGAPDCMRRRAHTISEKAPVRVWVDVTSSCGIQHEVLAARGTAALALVMQLIRQGRAVELLTYTSLDGQKNGQSVVVIRQQTAPVDIASVAHCLTSSGYSRTLCYGYSGNGNNYGGGWSDKFFNGGDWKKRLESARIILSPLAGEKDVILPAPYWDDQQDDGPVGLMFKDPAKWVMACVDSINSEEAGE